MSCFDLSLSLQHVLGAVYIIHCDLDGAPDCYPLFKAHHLVLKRCALISLAVFHSVVLSTTEHLYDVALCDAVLGLNSVVQLPVHDRLS